VLEDQECSERVHNDLLHHDEEETGNQTARLHVIFLIMKERNTEQSNKGSLNDLHPGGIWVSPSCDRSTPEQLLELNRGWRYTLLL
jgi:hypothetical protein